MLKQSIFALACSIAASGCVSLASMPDPDDGLIESTLVESAMAPAPATPKPALPKVPVAARPDPETRFDVSAENTPAKAFFMALIDGTPHNMVVHPDVAGEISISMKNVTVGDVLDAVNEVYGYGYRRNRSGFVVLPANVQTRIFQVDYLNLQRSGVSHTRVSSGQASDSSSPENRSSESANGLASGISGIDNRQATPMSSSRIETSYQADFWTELKATLTEIIGRDNDHQVVVNAQSGVVVVRALPEQLRNAQQYLKAVQSIASRQVVLEAKIVEVQLSNAYQAGINWVAVAQNSSGDTFTFGQAAPPGYRNSIDDLGGAPIIVEPGAVTTGFSNTTLGGALTMAFDVGDFNTYIELLELQGKTRVLSSPRVSTLNNQKAVIKAGSDEFFVTDVQSNTVTGTSSATSRNVQLTPFFSGVALDVTPQISANDEVILHIHPTVSEVTDQLKALTVSGETDTLPLAFSEIRESDSIVKARSGQIIVIGGLMRNSRRSESFGIPVLGKIPGMGRLFRSERDVEVKTELVIMLKPIVVDSEKVWTDISAETLDRIRNQSSDQ